MKRFKVGDPRSFHYLNQTNCYEVANVDDAREYIETRNAMDIVGIDQEEQVHRRNRLGRNCKQMAEREAKN